MRKFITFTLAMSLTGCAAFSDENFYGSTDPDRIAAVRAQINAQTQASNAQLLNRARQPTQPMNIPGLVPLQRPDGVWVYCRSATDNLATCIVR